MKRHIVCHIPSQLINGQITHLKPRVRIFRTHKAAQEYAYNTSIRLVTTYVYVIPFNDLKQYR